MKRKNITNVFVYVWLLLLAAFILFPLVYTVAASFKTNSEILAHPERIFPQKPTFDNYIEAWNSPNFSIKTMLFNSIIFTVGTVAMNLLTSSVAGYVFARGCFPGKNIIFTVFCALMFINLGSITMYPQFEIVNFLRIDKSLYTLLFIRMFGIPIANIYLVKSFISSGVPQELYDAAAIDGAGFVRTFVSVVLPMLVPILATITILAFQGSWNEYMGPMIWTMSKPEQRTLIVGVISLKSSDQAAAAWNLMLAGSTVALIPVLIVYAFCSKFFIQGISAGAVKG